MRLAVRELWMTFRLLFVLFAWVSAGAVVGLVPGAPSVTLERLAIGLGAASVVSAAVGAWSMGAERQAGRTGWLVTRTVPRGTYLVGWYAALVGVALIGLGLAAALGWLSLAGAPGAAMWPKFGAAILAVACTAAAAIALGLLLGALVRPWLAAGLTLLVCAAAGAGAWLAADPVGALPRGGHVLLARVAGTEPIVPDALRAAGIALALAAMLLILARVALERTEL